jgi:soluble lytic murein transglycosylase
MTLTPLKSVYESRLHAPAPRGVAGWAGTCVATLCLLLALPPAVLAQTGSDTIVEAREAFRKKDRDRLAAARAAALAAQHPLALWADYWDFSSHVADLQQSDIDAFYTRWPGTYVEDRLRNDWLLELGKRHDWAHFAADFARFRMNDDREVTCYAMLGEHLEGKDVRNAARAAWFAQKEADEGCALMAATLFDVKALGVADAWRKARLSTEANRLRAARQAVILVDLAAASSLHELYDSPVRYLARKASVSGRTQAELATLALIRMAASDPDAAAAMLTERWERQLPADLAAWAWASAGKQAALKLSADAPDFYQRASVWSAKASAAAKNAPAQTHDLDWPDDTLAWKLRAALRANNGAGRWQQVVQAVNAMSPAEQSDPAWVYWKARGLQSMARDSQDGAGLGEQSRALMGSIGGQFHFYGKLAAESLGQSLVMPPKPLALSAEERAAAASNPGLLRALQLITLGLRSEGAREWNFTLRGMGDRELLAAAQLACDREVWDRCINTSERTRTEVDMDQRFPTPFRKQVLARAKDIGLDPAYVYGLIRQESRFMMDARSGAGASGLMQIMPATARWTAKKIGLDFTHDLINDRDTNIKIGTSYLKLVLDDFDGSQAMAAAAYNAGPGRPRKWREGPSLEPAAWAENIPFSETREYVKKVLSNASYYAALLTGEAPTLKARLGRPIGPRDAAAASENKELP